MATFKVGDKARLVGLECGREFDELTVLSESMKEMVEASRLMNILAMLDELEVSFMHHGTDCRVFLHNIKEEHEEPEYVWAASIRPPKKERAQVKKHGFGTFEQAFKWVLGAMEGA